MKQKFLAKNIEKNFIKNIPYDYDVSIYILGNEAFNRQCKEKARKDLEEYIDAIRNKVKSQEKQIKLMQSINITENFVEKTKLYKLIEKLEEDEKYYDKANMEGYARATGRAIDMLTETIEED